MPAREWTAFEWDPNKDRRNKDKHGLSFDTARLIFDGPVLTKPDTRWDYGEPRFLATGYVRGVGITVVYTPRKDTVCRIISARKASWHERSACYALGLGPPP